MLQHQADVRFIALTPHLQTKNRPPDSSHLPWFPLVIQLSWAGAVSKWWAGPVVAFRTVVVNLSVEHPSTRLRIADRCHQIPTLVHRFHHLGTQIRRSMVTGRTLLLLEPKSWSLPRTALRQRAISRVGSMWCGSQENDCESAEAKGANSCTIIDLCWPYKPWCTCGNKMWSGSVGCHPPLFEWLHERWPLEVGFCCKAAVAVSIYSGLLWKLLGLRFNEGIYVSRYKFRNRLKYFANRGSWKT